MVGNKSDLELKREVDTERGKEFSLRYGMSFIETSALTGDNIDLLFETLIYKACVEEGQSIVSHHLLHFHLDGS